jgi:hypothetical protein
LMHEYRTRPTADVVPGKTGRPRSRHEAAGSRRKSSRFRCFRRGRQRGTERPGMTWPVKFPNWELFQQFSSRFGNNARSIC